MSSDMPTYAELQAEIVRLEERLDLFEDLLEAQDNLDNREVMGINQPSYFVLLGRRNDARLDLDNCPRRKLQTANVPVEPLCWVFEDELPESMTKYAYDALYPHSRVDVVRMFPIYGPVTLQQKERQ